MNTPDRKRQARLDQWFPTLVRYCGLGLMAVLIGSAVLGHLDYPAGFIAATGMILYKTVANGKNGDDS